jgi:prophage antirepressor-like protein
MDNTKIALFKGRKIRKTLYNNEWWFVVEDVVLALIDSNDPKQYIQRLKQCDSELAKGWVQIVHTLEVRTEGGPQKMNCANTEGIFRIIQSIPSPKAEPFKRWLARVGYERVKSRTYLFGLKKDLSGLLSGVVNKMAFINPSYTSPY